MTKARNTILPLLLFGTLIALFFSLVSPALAEDSDNGTDLDDRSSSSTQYPIIQNIRDRAKDQKQSFIDTIVNRQDQLRDKTMSNEGESDAAKDQIEERRQELQSHMEERRDKLERRFDEMREHFSDRLKNVFGRIVSRLSAAVERFEKIADRLESRIARLEESGLDMSGAREKLRVARAEVDTVGNDIEAIVAALRSEIDSTDEPEPRTLMERLRNAFSEIKGELRSAHGALRDVVEAIRSAVSEQGVPTSDSNEETNEGDTNE